MPEQLNRGVYQSRCLRGALAAVLVLFAAASATAATISIAWDPNPEPTVTGYVVYVGTSATSFTETYDVGSTTQFTWSNATSGVTYWFAVAAYTDPSNIGPTSTIAVTAPSVPAAPVPLAPSGTISTSTPTFSWNSVATAATYSLWVNDSTAQGKVQQTYSPSTVGCGVGGACSVTSPVALAAGSASWYVRASNSAGDGPWSTSMAFIVPSTSSDVTATSTTKVIPQIGWKLRYVDSQETVKQNGYAVNSFDGSTSTMWHTKWYNGVDPLPHEIQIDLGAAYAINGFRYLPRQDGKTNGRIGRYEFYVSGDGVSWGTPVSTGTFANDATQKQVTFPTANGRYVRLRALTEVNGKAYTSAAEINVLGSALLSASTVPLISQSPWRLRYVDSQETVAENGAAVNSFDSSTGTFWHSKWYNGADPLPHEIQIDLGSTYAVSGFRYLPRQDGISNGRIGQYEFYVSTDGFTWGTPVMTGTLVNDANAKQVTFSPKNGRYVRLRALTEVNGLPYTSMAELNVFGTAVVSTQTVGVLPRSLWQLRYVDSQETVAENGAAVNSFDGSTGTFWHTKWYNGADPLPHEIQIDLGSTYAVSGFRYLPRQDGSPNGRIGNYEFYVSTDGVNWSTPVVTGAFANDATEKQVSFTAKSGRYVRLRALSEVNGYPYTSMADFNVIGAAQ